MPIWSKFVTVNEKNQLPVIASCLLVELDDGRKGLVDTGCGDPAKYPEKERKVHAMDPSCSLGAALRALGIRKEEISFIALTHLHWDHAGGAGARTDEGKPALEFPGAVHFVHAEEWENGMSGDPVFSRAYPEITIAPLRDLGGASLHLFEEDEIEVAPGVRMIRSGGHTSGHCVVTLQDDKLELNHPDADLFDNPPMLIYISDLCPTQHHLHTAYHTAYDNFPLATRAWKREWMPRMAEEKTLVIFDHDNELFGATIRPDERREFVVDTGLRIPAV
jgi:glyoxylase-like metal-dependent hydrolase (beta-lactamase superfamily II)